MKWLANMAKRLRLGLGGTSTESASDAVVFPTVAVWESVHFDPKGFRLRDADAWIEWGDVVQIACVYEIHPVIIEDWDYVAFRCRDPQIATWVLLKGNESFIAEVERRFAALAAPPIGQWTDHDRCICSYTVWPRSRVGAPLFVTKRQPVTGQPTIAFQKSLPLKSLASEI